MPMNFLKLLTIGIWWGFAMIFIMIFGEYFFPGSLADSAFTDLGILIVFAMGVIDTIFSLGSSYE